ncbi:DNA repair protein rad2 [Binucleata daphniae]
MGVKRLWQLIKPASQPKHPKNEKLAIDTSIWLHYYKNIPQNLFVYYTTKRILKLLLDNNKPIFVFDGKTPLLKQKTIVERQKINIEAAARKYIKNEICKICNVSVRVCKHFAVEKNEIMKAGDKSICENVKKNKPKDWGIEKREYDKYHNSQETKDLQEDNNKYDNDNRGYDKYHNSQETKDLQEDNNNIRMVNDNVQHVTNNNKKYAIEKASITQSKTAKTNKNTSKRKRYFDDEIEYLENVEFKNLSQVKKLKVLVELREKRKMPTKITADSGIDFSVEQLNNLRKRNKISTMIRNIESKNKRIQSDCKTIYYFEENKQMEAVKDDDSNVCIENVFSSDENEAKKEKLDTNAQDNNKSLKTQENNYEDITKNYNLIDDVFKDEYEECEYEECEYEEYEECKYDSNICEKKANELLDFDINEESFDDNSEESLDDNNEESFDDNSEERFDNYTSSNEDEEEEINTNIQKHDTIELKNDIVQNNYISNDENTKEDIELCEEQIQPENKIENVNADKEYTEKEYAYNTYFTDVSAAEIDNDNIDEVIPHVSINNDYASDVAILQSKIKEIIKAFDLPYIDAPLEADSQCAYLSANKLVDGIITEDNDVFLYGCDKVYKNYYRKNKLVEEYKMCDISKIITRDEMILLSYFVGSDYTTGIKGIGIKNAYKKVKEAGNDTKIADFLFNLYYGTMYKELDEIEWKEIDKKKSTKYIISAGMTKEQTKEIMYYLDRVKQIRT